MTDLLQIRGLRKEYPLRRGPLQRVTGKVIAVDGVDLEIGEGECQAVVGESGSGKSTLGLCTLALVDATEGEVLFAGESLLDLPKPVLRRRRREFQMIFQDPIGSLNPRMTAGATLAEPLEIHKIVLPAGRRERVMELLERVDLPASVENFYPHELSGGQRQRLAIARALATNPRFVVADEPVSALDVSLRGQVIHLLADLRQRLGLTILFIAHDLAVVQQISDRVGVMYAGKIVELASTDRVYREPQHPYTVSLLSAVPGGGLDGRRSRIVLGGEPPDAANLPFGCRFHPRCPIVRDRCRREEPELVEVALGHQAACHFPGELESQEELQGEDGTFLG